MPVLVSCRQQWVIVAGKVYDVLTNKLKDGDLTNEKLREVIVKDLNDVFLLKTSMPVAVF